MAARNSKAKPESQDAGTDEMSMPAEKSEPVEGSEEPAENQGAEGEDEQVPETKKELIATRQILYLAKQYKAGDRLPVNNQEMVAAWIEAGSAAWRESGIKQFFP